MSALLFFHVLAAMTLVGGVLTAAIAGLAARRRDARQAELLRGLALRSLGLVALPATIATIALGEGLRAKEDAKGTWLDVAYPLTYIGVLLGGIALTLLAWRGRNRPRAARAADALGLVILAVLAAVLFLMTGKPGA